MFKNTDIIITKNTVVCSALDMNISNNTSVINVLWWSF